MARLFDRAIDNPAATFREPSDIMVCNELSRDEKIQVLRRWEYDARQLEVAQEENMISRERSGLSAVLSALQELDAEKLPSAPTKTGGA